MEKVVQFFGIQNTPSNVDKFRIALIAGVFTALVAGLIVGFVV